MKYVIICVLTALAFPALQAMEKTEKISAFRKPEGMSEETFKKKLEVYEKVPSFAGKIEQAIRIDPLECKKEEVNELIKTGMAAGISHDGMMKITLIEAIRAGNEDMVKWAVETGADVNDKKGLYMSILDFAKQVPKDSYRPGIVNYLLSKRAK